MKTTDYLIIAATFAYTYLFFEQGAGINFFIFSILLVLFSLLKDTTLRKQRSWIAAALSAMITGFSVFYYGNSFATTTNLLSLLMLSAISFNPSGSLFISAFNALYTYLLTIPAMMVSALVKRNNEANEKGLNLGKILLLILPLTVSFVFFLLYRTANPLFAEVTDKINLDFISVDWLLFAFYGLILMYGFFQQRVMKRLTEKDAANTDQLQFVSEEAYKNSWMASFTSLSSEIFIGTALFILLNLLLLMVNGIDVYYLYILQKLPDNLSLSQYLHDGTDSLIASIIFAIAIILFFFRGRLNFIAENRSLRWLSYIWIAQNILLILSTAKRNWFYISNFGLTHKRLGVYNFLLLCVVGLVTSLLKVAKVKSNWFLFRKNSWIWFGTLVLCSLINWDAIIAEYNFRLAYGKNVKPDIYYLGQLSYTAMPVLLHYYKLEKEGKTEGKYFGEYLSGIIAINSKNLINESSHAEWQSICIIKQHSLKQIALISKTANSN
jgi:hypothetical protein